MRRIHLKIYDLRYNFHNQESSNTLCTGAMKKVKLLICRDNTIESIIILVLYIEISYEILLSTEFYRIDKKQM